MKIIYFIILIFISSTLLAEDKNIDNIDLGNINVTEESNSSYINNDDEYYDVIESKQIELQNPDDLSDLFKTIPNVNAGGTTGINDKIYIRGLPEEDLYITIDGAKQSSVNTFHHSSNIVINPNILKDVDVTVGANSVAIYGLGGALEFTTKDAKDFLDKNQHIGGYIDFNYNTNNRIGGSGAIFGDILGYVDIMLYYNYTQVYNYKFGNGDRQFGNEGHNDDILLKVGYNINKKQRLVFSYDRVTDKGLYQPKPNLGSDYNKLAFTYEDLVPTEQNRTSYTLNYKLDYGDKITSQNSLYYTETSLNRDPTTNNLNDGNSTNNIYAKSNISNIGFISRSKSVLDTKILNSFIYGVMYDNQVAENIRNSVKVLPNQESNLIGIFIEDEITIIEPLTITPGVRYNYYDLRKSPNDVTDNIVTYSIYAKYKIIKGLSLSAGYNTLFNGAPMYEAFVYNSQLDKPSTKIESETGFNTEETLEYSIDDFLYAKNIKFKFTYFYTTINNYIDYKDPDGNGINEAYNTGNTNINGVELKTVYNLKNISAMFTYTHTTSKVADTGFALDSQGGDQFVLSLYYEPIKNLTLRWVSTFVLPISGNNFENGIDKDSYNVHDISASYSYKGFTIVAAIDNIFNQYYYEHTSYDFHSTTYDKNFFDYEPGVNFKLNLSYKY